MNWLMLIIVTSHVSGTRLGGGGDSVSITSQWFRNKKDCEETRNYLIDKYTIYNTKIEGLCSRLPPPKF